MVGSELNLTPKQENFCRAYLSVGEDTFCNAFKAYQKAGYSMNSSDKSNRGNAIATYQSKKVQARLMELMELAGFNDLAVNAEHLKVIKQDKDLSNKMRAISEYNKITGRSVKELGQGKITINIVNFEDGNNDTTQFQSQRETVSVRDIGEQGEEQSLGDPQEGGEDSDSGEQADNGSS